MAVQKQDDQHEHTFSSYVRIRDVVLKTYLGRWTIGRSGERGSGISVLPARYDDDKYSVIMYLCVYLKTLTFWKWICNQNTLFSHLLRQKTKKFLLAYVNILSSILIIIQGHFCSWSKEESFSWNHLILEIKFHSWTSFQITGLFWFKRLKLNFKKYFAYQFLRKWIFKKTFSCLGEFQVFHHNSSLHTTKIYIYIYMNHKGFLSTKIIL